MLLQGFGPVRGSLLAQGRRHLPTTTPRNSRFAKWWGWYLFWTLIAFQAICESSGSMHEVRAVAGESVDIPCEVDAEACGTVHSIKFYKDGNRVYMYSNWSNVDKPEADFLRPERRATFNLDADPPVLSIKEVYLVDEGIYSCEITYLSVQETCKPVSFTSLTTLSRPSPPEIRYDDGAKVNMKTIGPFTEGTKLTLTCEASGGKPVAQVTWWNGTENLDGQYSEIRVTEELGSGVRVVDVTLSRTDLHSRFECRAINDALEEALTTWVEVDVHVPPVSVEILEPEEPPTEGVELALKCESKGARPSAFIKWMNESEEVDVKPETESQLADDETFTSLSTYTFTPTRYDSGKEFKCLASNTVLKTWDKEPIEDTITLNVLYPPSVTLEPSGEFAVNETEPLVLTCKFEANPMNYTNVVWIKDGEVYTPDDDDDDDDDNSKDDDDDDEDDDDDFPQLTLKSTKREDKGVWSCQIENAVGKGESTTQLELDVFYAPVVKINVDPNTAEENENDNVTLTCIVLSGNPTDLVSVRWFLDDDLFDVTDDDTLVLKDVNRTNDGNYSCSGANVMGWGPHSEPMELLVRYPPGLPFIEVEPLLVEKGKQAVLTCNLLEPGRPPANDFRWHRDIYFQSKERDSSMIIDPVSLETHTNFTCSAINEVGEGPTAFLFVDVRVAPTFIDALPPSHGVLANQSDVSLTCRIECNPPCNITWKKNGDVIEESELYSIKTNELPPDPSSNHLDSVLSTLKWNLSAWPGGMLDRENDNAEYSCESSDNMIGPSVNSTTDFVVEYPPENISVSTDTIDLMEGEIPDSVVCSAIGLPEPKYMWLFRSQMSPDDDPQVISSENELKMDYELYRNRSGTYTCYASNLHGNQSAVVNINVMYKPECKLSKETTTGGHIKVTCEIEANPPIDDVEWTKDNETLEGDEFQIAPFDGEKSVVTITTRVRHYGTFTCSANSTLGSTDICVLDLTDDGGWLSKMAESKTIFVAAACVGLVVLLFVVVIIICLLWKRRSRGGDSAGDKKAPMADAEGDRAFYENLPFHGLQPPPNKPFKPILPDLEYADVDFPAQPLNNNPPFTKAKIVEKILEEIEDEQPSGSSRTPARPPRMKEGPRK